ncbi:GNAT family N-acetyltransferase [Bacillus cytotoxicus]|uniref:GNAT family N-acetyltransferase n=1 Tax=Bacillus cereus group sp. BfR-BA-01492 TaxID=2920361 RepID=UPI001F5673BC|nr:GNAT family N-acetyltransferase [Bacillus cereus group sp. BfR-BA-01492]EMA6344416.1 GNAT family N-acetyltransferase [Bacillus cytotoxicus]
MDYFIFESSPNKKIRDGILQLHETIFNHSNDLIKQMQNKPKLLINLAMHNQQVVGYKIGYELNDETFYSWLGGVANHYRNQGIGSQLMKAQHQLLKEKGYSIVQTKTKNKWRNMLILNIKSGFDIIGTYTDEKGKPKIILQKLLL